MTRTLKLAYAVFMLTALQGCVTMYTPAPNEPMATVRMVGFGRPQICKDGKFYWAPEVANVPDTIRVPAGQRLVIGAHMISDGYQVMYICRPFLGFTPTPEQTYVLNSALGGEGRCLVELVREDLNSKTGLALEPSVGKPECFARKESPPIAALPDK